MESKFLFAAVALHACELYGIELAKPMFRDVNGGKTGTNCVGNGVHKSVSVRVSLKPVNQGYSCHSLTHCEGHKLLQT